MDGLREYTLKLSWQSIYYELTKNSPDLSAKFILKTSERGEIPTDWPADWLKQFAATFQLGQFSASLSLGDLLRHRNSFERRLVALE